MMSKITRYALSGLMAGALASACVSMDYGIELASDLSGTMDFAVSFDVDQMAYSMAVMQRMFQGEEGEPSSEEVRAAREEVLAELENQREQIDLTDIREEAREDLPEGVELVDAVQSEDGLRTALTFRFDHVRRLADMEISPELDSASASPTPAIEPFGGLTFRDDGDTFLLSNTPVDPLEQAESAGSPVQDMAPQMKMMIQSMSHTFSGPMVTFSVKAPFEVVEHNATRVDGQTLYWEYDLDSFLDQEEPGSIRVRFRKP